MFSHTSSGTRRLRTIGGSIAAAAMIAAFTLTASSASAAVGSGEPLEVTAPSISGSVTVGSDLTADPGTWTASDASTITYDYEWTDDQGNFLESGTDYQVESTDVGHQITLTVTASDDLNDNSDSVTTATVPAIDFSNVSAPVLTGSTVVGGTLTGTDGTWSKSGLTFTYDWGISYGESGDQTDPADPTNTHVVTLNDQAGTLVFVVTATDSTGSIQVSTAATGVTIPAPPVANDSGLTAANEGGVTGTQSTTVATVVLPAAAAATSGKLHTSAASIGVNPGDRVYVYGYSTATPVGFFVVSDAHTIAVPLTGLSKGLHKLAILDPNGVLVGWLSVTAGGGLASTGVNVNAPLELGGAGLLILIGLFSVIFVTRSRRKTV